MRFFEAIYNNIHHIPLLICYVFNAISVSADTSFTLMWLGINSHFAMMMSLVVITGWFLLFLSSHNDTRQEDPHGQTMNETGLRTFIRNAIDIRYLHQSAPNKHQDCFHTKHFSYLYCLTVFHYFKKSFADRIYLAIKQQADWQKASSTVLFTETKDDLTALNPSSLIAGAAIAELGFTYEDDDAFDLEQYQKECNQLINGYIHALQDHIKTKNPQTFLETINVLDQFSIDRRNNIVTAINDRSSCDAFFSHHLKNLQNEEITAEEKKTTLKLLLKIEHTYTLASQRSFLPFINAFSKINALSNGCILLASGFLKVGINPLYLTAFACSGIACSYILTGPKILNIMRNISGYWENYTRSTSQAARTQQSSFVFKLSLITAMVTASASALFAYYVLSTFCQLFTHPALLITGYCVAGLLTSIAFFGAFCLYFDSIFSILSSNKKDIYAPDDNCLSLFSQTSINLGTVRGIGLLSCLVGILYAVSLQHNTILLASTAMLMIMVTFLISDTREQSLAFLSLAIGLCLAACNIHQICTIFAITLNPISLPGLLIFASVQASTMTCTFYKGLNKCAALYKKIAGTQRPTGISPSPRKGNNMESPNPIGLSPAKRSREQLAYQAGMRNQQSGPGLVSCEP